MKIQKIILHAAVYCISHTRTGWKESTFSIIRVVEKMAFSSGGNKMTDNMSQSQNNGASTESGAISTGTVVTNVWKEHS